MLIFVGIKAYESVKLNRMPNLDLLHLILDELLKMSKLKIPHDFKYQGCNFLLMNYKRFLINLFMLINFDYKVMKI